MDQDKTEKPKRIMLLHLPVYEGDDIIINQAPPAAKGQWARQLLIRALQIDVQFMETIRAEVPTHQGEDINVNTGDVRGIVKEEIEALLPRIEEAIQEEVKNIATQNLDGLQDKISEAVQAAVRSALIQQQVSMAPPLAARTKELENVPAWRQALGQGLEE